MTSKSKKAINMLLATDLALGRRCCQRMRRCFIIMEMRMERDLFHGFDFGNSCRNGLLE